MFVSLFSLFFLQYGDKLKMITKSLRATYLFLPTPKSLNLLMFSVQAEKSCDFGENVLYSLLGHVATSFYKGGHPDPIDCTEKAGGSESNVVYYLKGKLSCFPDRTFLGDVPAYFQQLGCGILFSYLGSKDPRKGVGNSGCHQMKVVQPCVA